MSKPILSLAVALFAFSSAVADTYDERIWTDSAGGKKAKATYVLSRNGKVQLKRPNGKTVVISLEKLSKEDRSYVRRQGFPAEIREYLDRGDQELATLIEKVREGKLKIKEKRKEIERLKKGFRLAHFKKGPAKIGEIGRWAFNAEAVQVVDEMNLIVRLGWVENGYNISGRGAYARAVKAVIPQTQLVWLKGMSTKGIVDATAVKLPGVLEVTNTKRYSTAAGSNTIFLLEPLDMSKYWDPVEQQ